MFLLKRPRSKKLTPLPNGKKKCNAQKTVIKTRRLSSVNPATKGRKHNAFSKGCILCERDPSAHGSVRKQQEQQRQAERCSKNTQKRRNFRSYSAHEQSNNLTGLVLAKGPCPAPQYYKGPRWFVVLRPFGSKSTLQAAASPPPSALPPPPSVHVPSVD